MKLFLCLLLVLCVAACEADYYECPTCGASFKQEWYQGGLPGQIKHECRRCRVPVFRVRKEDSRWDHTRGADF